MNKKGIVLLLLFVVSSLGVIAVSNAKPQTEVEVTLAYVPPSNIDVGQVWVEFDDRFISDNQVFGQNDKIYFAFYYDVAFVSWAGANAYGDGWQPDNWFFDVPDENGTYTETRFYGMMNVYLDDVALGLSNFDISATIADTYQEVKVELYIGWHTLTVVAVELVSDETHTSWHWEYSKDEVRFYVGKTAQDIPPLEEDSPGTTVNVEATPVEAANLPQHAYNWTDFFEIRPVVDAANYSQLVQNIDEGETATATVAFNSSWVDVLGLSPTQYGVTFTDMYEMGPSAVTWFANTGDLVLGSNVGDLNSLTATFNLTKGINYVYCTVWGPKADDYAHFYGISYPTLRSSTQIFTIIVGELPGATSGAGLSFGAFISVSILGLAAAIMLRRRK